MPSQALTGCIGCMRRLNQTLINHFYSRSSAIGTQLVNFPP